MAVRAADQATLFDQTDPYSVILTSDAYVFPGNASGAATAGSCTTQILAYQGDEQVPASVTIAEITDKPTGITVSVDTNATAPTLTITASASFTAALSGYIDIPVHVNNAVVIHKKFAVSVAKTGATGTHATSVIIGNESVSIPCDKDGKTSAASEITIPFAGYLGTSRKACTVSVSGLPSGITVDTNTAATTSADGSLVLSVASGSTLGGTASGEITLTFSCNSQTHVKKFSWAKAITGATGGQGPQGTAATSVVCGNEAVTIACDKDGKAKAASTIVIPFAGYIGTARAACTVSYSTLPSGVTLATNGNKAATTSADGSLTFNVASGANFGTNATMTGEITLTFTCNSQTFVKKFSWSKSLTGATGAQGPQGPQGDDAITLVIISSNGLIFKNTAITTTLTAHVYVGGVEVTGSDLTALGTIKWYKDGNATAVATGATLQVSSGDVDSKADYVAQLEN